MLGRLTQLKSPIKQYFQGSLVAILNYSWNADCMGYTLFYVICVCRRSLFHGKLVVHSGGGASGFKNSKERDSYDTDGVCLFHVKGTRADNTYGVQVMMDDGFFLHFIFLLDFDVMKICVWFFFPSWGGWWRDLNSFDDLMLSLLMNR